MKAIDRRAAPGVLITSFLAVLLCLQPVQASPTIQHWTTTNGVRVYFVHAPEIPMLDVRAVFSAGSSRDEARQGVASLTADMLREGAGGLDANAFNDQMAATGARFSTGALRDMAWVELRTLTAADSMKPALALMESVLSSPTFDSASLDRVKAGVLVGLEQEKQSPGRVADKAFYQAVYGPHPYASPVNGTAETVSAVDRDAIAAFHRRYYVAGNAIIALVGDLDEAAARRVSEALSAKLPSGPAASPLPTVPQLSAGAEQRVDFPSIQSHVRVGQPGMKRGDPDYFALLVGNHVLGGSSLTSILFDEVREKRGLSYSVSSYFAPMAALGPFTASLQTDASQEEEALSVLEATLRRFIAEGPTEDELEQAKRNLVGGFPLRVNSNSKIVEYIAMIGFYGLPLDYLDAFPGRVEAVTVAAVKDAFQRRLDPDRMVRVVVGRARDGNDA